VEQTVISGGAARLDLVRQLLADATGKPVLTGDADEPVMLGAAMLGGVASGAFVDVTTAMTAMSKAGRRFAPAGAAIAEKHRTRFVAFEQLQRVARQVRP